MLAPALLTSYSLDMSDNERIPPDVEPGATAGYPRQPLVWEISPAVDKSTCARAAKELSESIGPLLRTSPSYFPFVPLPQTDSAKTVVLAWFKVNNPPLAGDGSIDTA